MQISWHIGRCVFASFFLLAALHKLAHFDIVTGGSRIVWEGTTMGKRMDEFLSLTLVHGGVSPLIRSWYPLVFLCATVLELVGSVALVMNKPIGAKILLFVLGMITMVMHPVSDVEERVACMKNMSLAGALVLYLDTFR